MPLSEWFAVTDVEMDVAVLGSGAGGTLTALLLDRIGLRVAVFDRTAHPRFAIGESSIPTGNLILRDLADRYDLPRLRPLTAYGPWHEAYPEVVVGRKRGFSYFRHRPQRPYTPHPDHRTEFLVAASSDPYRSDTHWLRADVDAFLAGEVRRAGIPLLERTRLTDIEREERWALRGRREHETVRCTAEFVVDATGTGGLLQAEGFTEPARRPLATRTRTLFTHLRGLDRWRDAVARGAGRTEDHPFPCDEAAVHHVLEEGWIWEFRFNDGRTSVGLVLDAGKNPPEPDLSPDREWRRHLRRYPSLEARLAGVERADPPGGIVRTRQLQRLVRRSAGPGWALLPFTAGFVDPLHSTGIAHTMSGIERLVEILDAHGPSPPLVALDRYSRELEGELRFIDDLVRACYRALPSFRAWVASTKLYFAAATRYERRRVAARGRPGDASGFLCARNDGLRNVTREACERLASWPPSGPPPEDAVARYEGFIEEALRPYDEVGLFDPAVPRMHSHTAVPA